MDTARSIGVKLFKVWGSLNNPKIVCDKTYLDRITELSEDKGFNSQDIVTRFIDIENIHHSQNNGILPDLCHDDIIHIQFSSGSTGDPKGVIVTHGGLLANLEDMSEAMLLNESDSAISWMPLTHDMGLVCHLLPLAININQFSMETDQSIRNPSLLLEKISENRLTFTQSPNFGLSYILLHDGKGKLRDCDLSSLRILLNGAEPINYDLCKNFILKMHKYKINPNVIYPGYGLAEATLAVSIDNPDEPIKHIIVDRRHINIGDKVVYLDCMTDNGTIFVQEGYPTRHCFIELRDQEGNKLPENTIGIIYIKGNSVTNGFYNNPQKTAEVITEDGWLNTGDLGFFMGGKLVIVGRIKDIFFVNGQNFYSHDVERVAQEITGIEVGKIAITAAYNTKKRREDIVAFIVYTKDISDVISVIRALKIHVNKVLGFAIDQFVFVNRLPKTTSGKVQRFALSKDYADGKYDLIIEKINEQFRNDDNTDTVQDDSSNWY